MFQSLESIWHLDSIAQSVRRAISAFPIIKSVEQASDVRLLRDYLTYLRVEKGLRPLTCAAYQRDLLQFSEHLEREAATFLTAKQEHVAGFMEHLRQHQVDSRTIAKKTSCLRGLYRWLLIDKRIKHDPTLHVESPKSWKVLPKSLAEVEVILGAPARRELPPGGLVTTIGPVVPDAWWQSEDALVWINLDSGRVAEIHCVDGPSDLDPLYLIPVWLRRWLRL